MKSKAAELLFLGTGGSMGIPVVGCYCGVCRSSNPLNKRLRPSALIKTDEAAVLIDAGPDFRAQALQHQIDRLDGVLLTHAHHDHTCGIDDLRAYHLQNATALPCLVSRETSLDLKDRFKYIFEKMHSPLMLVSKLHLVELPEDRGECTFAGLPIRYFSYGQGGMKVNGYRMGSLGFVSDIKEYPDTIFEDLKGVRTLVVSALRFEPSPVHFNIEDAIRFSETAGAEETWFTHIAHEVEHDTVSKLLPSNVHLAYDGLTLNFTI